MDIQISTEDAKATIKPVGKLTVQTAPELEQALSGLSEDIMAYNVDLSELEYTSSAGLRVLVNAQKNALRKGGSMKLINPVSDVKEVFEMTGLTEVFDIVME